MTLHDMCKFKYNEFISMRECLNREKHKGKMDGDRFGVKYLN